MPDPRQEVFSELERHLPPAKLDASALASRDAIYAMTLGPFYERAVAKGNPDIWEGRLKDFVLHRTRGIAVEAKNHAANGVIDGKTLAEAAIVVMKAANKYCTLTLDEQGRPKGIMADPEVPNALGGIQDGDICGSFLATV